MTHRPPADRDPDDYPLRLYVVVFWAVLMLAALFWLVGGF